MYVRLTKSICSDDEGLNNNNIPITELLDDDVNDLATNNSSNTVGDSHGTEYPTSGHCIYAKEYSSILKEYRYLRNIWT